MKLVLLLICIAITSTFAYESYWAKGESLLTELQNGKDEIFVATFYDPTPVKDSYTRQAENNKVQDDLQSEVLNQLDGKPLKIRYASADTTESENANLMYKAGIKDEYLEDGPVVLVTRKGSGYIVWGPTVIHQVEKFVKEMQDKATKEQGGSTD